MIDDSRTSKFTNAEFKALPRYSNGRIIDLPMNFMWLTDSQKENLHDDDYSYYDELEEECRIMMEEFNYDY